jgi:hypothetical protein
MLKIHKFTTMAKVTAKSMLQLLVILVLTLCV